MSVELSNAAEFISWMNMQAHLNAVSAKAKKRFVARGQVYWCHFGLNIGSEMSKSTPRPAIIIQNFSANKSSSNTIVVPVTHSTSSLPCMIPLAPVKDTDGKVILDGQADTAHIICVSKARLGDLITALSPSEMKKIDRAVAISLDLLGYYDTELKKYAKLRNYTDKLKEDRNIAQDKIIAIREIVETQDFNEDSLKKLREILDIQ